LSKRFGEGRKNAKWKQGEGRRSRVSPLFFEFESGPEKTPRQARHNGDQLDAAFAGGAATGVDAEEAAEEAEAEDEADNGTSVSVVAAAAVAR
jgi:hypothetical protein